MRRFVVIGQGALASDAFLMNDVPGTAGRLDVLVRCIRATMLVSHGVRRDTVLYLLLLGGPRAPRVVRFDGALAKFLRPDEHQLTSMLKKVLATRADEREPGFVEMKPGISIASGGLLAIISDLGGAAPFVLEEGAPDVRGEAGIAGRDVAFFLGDHQGFDEITRAALDALGARPLGVGPTSLHTEDVIAIVANELDRREIA